MNEDEYTFHPVQVAVKADTATLTFEARIAVCNFKTQAEAQAMILLITGFLSETSEPPPMQ